MCVRHGGVAGRDINQWARHHSPCRTCNTSTRNARLADARPPGMCFCVVACLLQVDQLSAQLKDAQKQLEDKQRLSTSLVSAEKRRLEAEEKLAAALRHNADTQV